MEFCEKASNLRQIAPNFPRKGRTKKNTPIWSVPRLNPSGRVYVLGSGPSAAEIDVSRLRGQGLVIAINSWLYKAPWADVLYWADGPSKWFKYHKKNLHKFEGQFMATRSPGCSVPGLTVRRLHGDVTAGLCKDPHVVGGFCSGANSLNIAYHLVGPDSEIVMIGFDFQGDAWYDKPWQGEGFVSRYDVFAKSFFKMSAELARENVRVVNVSPISKLECFERGDLEDWW